MAFLKNISSFDSVSDAELVTLFQQTGELKVLAALYQRYMDLVYGVCLKYLSDSELSRDAVMNIFEELSVKLKRHEVGNFRGWLYTFSKNYCLMHLRSPKNLKTTEFKPEIMQSQVNGHLQSDMLEKEEHYKILAYCLETLSAEQKLTVELFYLKNKCYNEIAEITGYEWKKVRSHIQNGKRNLKLCMENKQESMKVN